jgi:hypothetical protein
MEVVVAVSIVYRCLWTQILQHDSQKKFPPRKRYWWEIENLDLAAKSGMTLLFGVILLIVFSVSYVTKIGRIKRDPHVQAQILHLWVIKNRYGRETGRVGGFIRFKRSAGEKTYSCEVSATLGNTADNLKVGDLIEIVPRLDSCYEPVVLPYDPI